MHKATFKTEHIITLTINLEVESYDYYDADQKSIEKIEEIISSIEELNLPISMSLPMLCNINLKSDNEE